MIPNYNPDVLTCLANLSNDEVFTPPDMANRMLDLLPSSLWSDPHARFLDPVSKTGVFLREIARRLMTGLAEQIPDVQERADHILKEQLFGLAVTELTGLLSRRSVYCSKTANGHYSVCTAFNDEQGNIRYEPTAHTWESGRCRYCGASREVYDRGEALESHAYRFIHADNPENLFSDMRFDVIIGNPPYQLNDGGNGASASPIYHLFVEQSIKLNPRYLVMIIPARWYAGGKGLDDFRDKMLNDTHVRTLVDFPLSSECFPNVEIKGGVCYFLWDREYDGPCSVTTMRKDKASNAIRPLLEKGCTTFIRYNEAISILHKVQKFGEEPFSKQVSSRKPFGFKTLVKSKKEPFNGAVKLYANKEEGYVCRDEITQNTEWIDQYKIYISRAYGAGEDFPHQILNKPFLGNPNTCCSETYVVIGPYANKRRAENVIGYIKTKFFRFLVLLKKNTQDAPARVYLFVPVQNFDEAWTDEKLYAKYGLTDEEITFIESMIRPME